jgi:hypothetical protein
MKAVRIDPNSLRRHYPVQVRRVAGIAAGLSARFPELPVFTPEYRFRPRDAQVRIGPAAIRYVRSPRIERSIIASRTGR